MDWVVGYYQHSRDTAGKDGGVALSRIVERIRSGDKGLADATVKARRLAADTDNPQPYREFKSRNLVAITAAGTFPLKERKDDYLQSATGLVAADLDHMDGGAAAAIAQLREDPHIALAFISPSGDGVKALLPVNPIPTERQHYPPAWAAVDAYLERQYGLKGDKAVKNLSRLTFLAHDPGCHYNPDAEPLAWGISDYAADTFAALGYSRDTLPAQGNTASNPGDNLAQVREVMPGLAIKLRDGTGNYNDRLAIAGGLAAAGLPAEEVIQWLKVVGDPDNKRIDQLPGIDAGHDQGMATVKGICNRLGIKPASGDWLWRGRRPVGAGDTPQGDVNAVGDMPSHLRPAYVGYADTDAARLLRYAPERFRIEQQKVPRLLFRLSTGLWADLNDRTWGETSGSLKGLLQWVRGKAAAELRAMGNMDLALAVAESPTSKQHYDAVKSAMDVAFLGGDYAAAAVWPADIGKYHQRPVLPLAVGGGYELGSGATVDGGALGSAMLPATFFRVKPPPAERADGMWTDGANAARAFLQGFMPVVDRVASLMVQQEKAVDIWVAKEVNRGKSTVCAMLAQAMGAGIKHWPQSPALRTSGGFTTLASDLTSDLLLLLDEADRMPVESPLGVSQVDAVLSDVVEVHIKGQMPELRRRLGAVAFVGNDLPPLAWLDRGMVEFDAAGNPSGRVNKCCLALEGLPYLADSDRPALFSADALGYLFALLLELAAGHIAAIAEGKVRFADRCLPVTAAAMQAGNTLITAAVAQAQMATGGEVEDQFALARQLEVTGDDADRIQAQELRDTFPGGKTAAFSEALADFLERNGLPLQPERQQAGGGKYQKFYIGLRWRKTSER